MKLRKLLLAGLFSVILVGPLFSATFGLKKSPNSRPAYSSTDLSPSSNTWTGANIYNGSSTLNGFTVFAGTVAVGTNTTPTSRFEVTNGSISVRGNNAGYTVQGIDGANYSISYTTATGVNLTGTHVVKGTGTVQANASLVVTPPSCVQVNFPILQNYSGWTSSNPLVLNGWTANAANFTVFSGATAPVNIIWQVDCK